MKFLLLLFLLCVLPQKSYALTCLAQGFSKDVFDSMDFIAKGTVSKSWIDKLDPRHIGNIPFRLTVEKAWKGAEIGDEVTISYELLGGDGFPYQEGKTYIIYANKDSSGVLTKAGCPIFEFPIPPELKEFASKRPYYLADKTKEELRYIEIMTKRLESLPEDTLDQYSQQRQ